MTEWKLLTCIHGVREGLDSHQCLFCQKIARAIGYDVKSDKTYIFTDEILKKIKEDKEKKNILESIGI